MILAAVLIFILGYAAIAFEHPLKINKTAPALLTGALIWTILAGFGQSADGVLSFMDHEIASKLPAGMELSFLDKVKFFLKEHLGEISEILFLS